MRNKNLHPKKRFERKFLTIAFLLFLALLIVGGIDLYRRTFISWYILLVPLFFGPLLLTPKAKLLTGETNLKAAVIMTYLYFMPAFFYVPLAVNFYFNIENGKSENFKIIKKGAAFGGKRSAATPYAIIIFKGERKQLFFHTNEREAIFNAERIKIEYCKGALQFYVLKHYDLN